MKALRRVYTAGGWIIATFWAMVLASEELEPFYVVGAIACCSMALALLIRLPADKE